MIVGFQNENQTKQIGRYQKETVTESTHAGLVGEYLSMQLKKRMGETCSWQLHFNWQESLKELTLGLLGYKKQKVSCYKSFR
jgi:hypothetical protein